MYTGGGYPTQHRLTPTSKVFDEKEVFAIVMEPEPGGELLDKVVKVCEKVTFMVERLQSYL